MPKEKVPTIAGIVRIYKEKINEIVSVVNDPNHPLRKDKKDGKKRAIGGVVRSLKGALLEHITEKIVKIAWHNLTEDTSRLRISSGKEAIPIKKSYIRRIKDQQIRKRIQANEKKYAYDLCIDKHVYVDNVLVMGIECKAYTENAMLKRVLVDFHFLQLIHKNITCCLFQLESQLGGDYSKLPKTVFGSFSTHSIMSYFENVELHIFTLLEGERNINKPIHKFFKPLEYGNVERAVKLLEHHLRKFV